MIAIAVPIDFIVDNQIVFDRHDGMDAAVMKNEHPSMATTYVTPNCAKLQHCAKAFIFWAVGAQRADV